MRQTASNKTDLQIKVQKNVPFLKIILPCDILQDGKICFADRSADENLNLIISIFEQITEFIKLNKLLETDTAADLEYLIDEFIDSVDCMENFDSNGFIDDPLLDEDCLDDDFILC